MEVSNDSEFRYFHQKGVDGGLRAPFRNLVGTKQGKSGGCKTRKDALEDRETTDLSAMGK